jgi:hypothetical protein
MAMRDMHRSPGYKAKSYNPNRIVEKFKINGSTGITEEDGVTVTLSFLNISESVRISARVSDIMTEGSRGFHHSLQTNVKYNFKYVKWPPSKFSEHTRVLSSEM